MNIRTILFDLDGTLIDTNQLITASFKHTFDYYKLKFTEEEMIEFNGPPLVQTFKNIDALRADKMVETYREQYRLIHDQYVKLFPQVTDTLQALKEKELQLGVVTTKMAAGADLALDFSGITDYFDTVVALDHVKHAKPHPEPVLKAMLALDGEPQSTLMVGDNSHDIEAGNNAGVQTAAVAWSQKGKERLLGYNPNYMLENMRDLLQIVDV